MQPLLIGSFASVTGMQGSPVSFTVQQAISIVRMLHIHSTPESLTWLQVWELRIKATANSRSVGF